MTANSENASRRCPYCGEVKSSQGLYAHVMNSSGNGHGEFREVPDDFKLEDAEIVAEAPGSSEKRKSGIEAGERYYFCLWCNQLFKGERGYKVHLKQTQGSSGHPEDASLEDRNYTLVPADKDGQPFLSEEELTESVSRGIDEENRFGVGVGLEDTRRSYLNVRNEDEYDIPDAPKADQVAAVICQNPPLFHDPSTVMEIVDCSRSTFYDGRRLYQNKRGQKSTD